MAQHDYSIANQGFPATRADINNVLSAIATNNSGTSAPSTQYAGQFWIDTTSSTWILYMHDGADDIQFAQIDTSANTVNFIDSTVNADLLNDTSPQLGGNLDLNSNDITGTGNINITGTGTFSGTLTTGAITSTGNFTFNVADGMNINAKESLNINIDTDDNDSSRSFAVTSGSGGTSETLISASEDAGVNLYYDNSKKFETTTTGIAVTGGVALGGTGTANTLDDYEEGTFTPEFADASSGGNVAIASTVGQYVKIGNQVTVYISLFNIDTTGLTSGNTIFIRNLPFTAKSNNIGTHGSVYFDRFNFTNYVVSTTVSNDSYMVLKDIRDGLTDISLTVASVISSGGSDLSITHTYQTT